MSCYDDVRNRLALVYQLIFNGNLPTRAYLLLTLTYSSLTLAYVQLTFGREWSRQRHLGQAAKRRLCRMPGFGQSGA